MLIGISISQLKFLYPLKTLVFPAFSPPRFGPFPSFFPLREEMRETFLGRPYDLIQQPCGSSLGLSGGVGVNVHCGTYIRMSQQLLHILGCGPVREKVGRICMPQQMEVKVIHIPDFLSGVSAYAADRCRGFIGSIRSQADERNLGVIFRGCLCPGQGVDLVVGAVLFLDDAIVVLGVQRPVFYAVQHLLLFGFSQDSRQGVAEIHSTDFLRLEMYALSDFLIMVFVMVSEAVT